uniref:SAP domain-containing protein n=1 Tax=Periophthalmus magnuspinnatus TaxID=409849 RepID=A0A3B4AR87_9GOBI
SFCILISIWMDSDNTAAALTTGSSRKQSDILKVIDLKAELKKRNLDTTGVKSVLSERLKKAIEEEGGNPDEIVISMEANPKKAPPKRAAKGIGKASDASKLIAFSLQHQVDFRDQFP